MNRPLWVIIASLLAVRCVLAGPATKPATGPALELKHLTLHLAPLGPLPLQYRLLPDQIDLTPGNAAALYLTACTRPLMSGADDDQTKKDIEGIDAWLAGESKGLDRKRAEHLLGNFQGALHLLELGARREECRWETAERIDGFATLLPQLSELRVLARLLALQAHLQIVDAQYDRAAHTLQTGFALARNVSKGGFLIQMMVGTGISATMCEQIEFWITTPGSPNLYWPLAHLPSPFMDLHSAMEHEHAGVYYSIPHLKEAAEGKLSTEHYAEMLSKLMEYGSVTGDSALNSKGAAAAFDQAAVTVMLSAQAKASLPSMGYDAKTIEVMQPTQAIGLWLVQSYERSYHELTKSLALPLYQCMEIAHKADDDLASAKNMLNVFQPATYRARLHVAQLDRRIGELRSLEAIRAYAATHGGTLPPTLAGIAEMPAPLDPLTGQPFVYRVEKGMASLDIPAMPEQNTKPSKRDEISIVN